MKLRINSYSPGRSLALIIMSVLMIVPAAYSHDSSVPRKNRQTFYHIQGQDITRLSAWASQADGKGSNPRSFESDSTQWTILHDVSLNGQFTIKGRNSAILVEGNDLASATLTLLPGAQLNALVDVAESGQLNILSRHYPTLGMLLPGSTVVFTLDEKVIPYHDYYNLSLVGCKPVFKEAADKTVKVRGTLTLSGNVVFPQARDNVEYNFLFHGPYTQQINTGKNVLRAFNIVFKKSEGIVRMMQGNTISADNHLLLEFTQDAAFDDYESTLISGKDVTIKGSANNYNFSGTLVLSGQQEGMVAAPAGGRSEIVIDGTESPVVLNNLIIRNTTPQSTTGFSNNTLRRIEIRNDFIVESTAAGKILFNENQVHVGKEFKVQNGFKGSIEKRENVKSTNKG
jgi:hypothetical protein